MAEERNKVWARRWLTIKNGDTSGFSLHLTQKDAQGYKHPQYYPAEVFPCKISPGLYARVERSAIFLEGNALGD